MSVLRVIGVIVRRDELAKKNDEELTIFRRRIEEGGSWSGRGCEYDLAF